MNDQTSLSTFLLKMSLRRNPRSSSRCLTGSRQSPQPRRILSRPWLKHRSNSTPTERFESLKSRIWSTQSLHSKSTCSHRDDDIIPANLHGIDGVTSSGSLFTHVLSDRTRPSYLRLASDPGTCVGTERVQPVQRKMSDPPFSGILLSMSRRLSRIWSREQPEAVETLEHGTCFVESVVVV